MAHVDYGTHIVTFSNGEKCTLEGLGEPHVTDMLYERGVSMREIVDAARQVPLDHPVRAKWRHG